MTSSLEISQPQNLFAIQRLSNKFTLMNELLGTKEKKHKKINIFSYYPDQIEKNNCLGETEFASGKALNHARSFSKRYF